MQKSSFAQAQARQDAELDKLSGLDAAKEGSKRSVKFLLPLLAVIALVAAAFIFKDYLPSSVKPGGGVSILLTVTSNPKTRVIVVPADPARKEIDLGDAPLDKITGAMVGDTIVLQNPDICIRHEETIQFGEPFKEKKIEKVFGEGQLKVLVTPSNLKGLSVWCNNQRIGNIGQLPLKLYEGKHSLEIRGDALRVPFPFEVNIDKDKINTLAKPLDLTTHVDK